MSFETSALILSWIAILLLALVVSGLVRQVHALTSGAVRPVEAVGPRPGSPAPGLERLGVGGSVPALLLFLSPDCRTCGEVLAEAAAHIDGRRGIVVRALYAGAVPASAADLPVDAYGHEAQLFEHYDAIATPFAVLVDGNGRVVRSEPLGSSTAVRALLDRVLAADTGAPLVPDRANPLEGSR